MPRASRGCWRTLPLTSSTTTPQSGPAFARERAVPMTITSHGPATGHWGEYLAAAGPDICLVAISQSQIDLSPELPWYGVVHNAIDVSSIPCIDEKEDYLVWLGPAVAGQGRRPRDRRGPAGRPSHCACGQVQ